MLRGAALERLGTQSHNCVDGPKSPKNEFIKNKPSFNVKSDRGRQCSPCNYHCLNIVGFCNLVHIQGTLTKNTRITKFYCFTLFFTYPPLLLNQIPMQLTFSFTTNYKQPGCHNCTRKRSDYITTFWQKTFGIDGGYSFRYPFHTNTSNV